MTTPKIAVVGAGYWGKNLVRNFADLGGLGGVVDPRADVAGPLSTQFAAPVLDLEAALAAPEIAGVAIATPAETHADIALRAFAAGKHVYVEKPMALTIPDAERMVAASERRGRVLMVGHLLQYHPAFATMRQHVRDGLLGALRTAYSHRLSLGKTRVEENVLWSFAPHDVSMLLALFDAEPTGVSGAGGAFLTPGVEDEYRLDMRFSGGRRAHVFASWLHPFKEHRLVVTGEAGMAVFEDSAPEGQKLRLYRHRFDMGRQPPEPVKAEPEALPFPKDEPLQQECAHFLDCIARGARPRTDGLEGLRVLRVLTQVATN